jgi:hypothetical protein
MTDTTKMIVIMGASNSGKTTLQKALCITGGYEPVLFSHPMKRFVGEKYGVTVEFLDSQNGKKTLVYPLAGPDHPMYGVTYGDLMIRWWKASPGIDPLMWLAETQAEVDYHVGGDAKALVFADVRNDLELNLIRVMVDQGHDLIVVHLERSEEQLRDSDVGCNRYISELRQLTSDSHYLRMKDRALTDLVGAVRYAMRAMPYNCRPIDYPVSSRRSA